MPSLLSTASFSERVRNMSPDEIRIPPEPPGRCSNHLQVGIESGKLENVSAGRGGCLETLLSLFLQVKNPALSLSS